MTKQNSQELEIARSKTARLFEILPGVTSWLFLLSPIFLSFVRPVWVAYIIIAYDLLWLTKAFGLSTRLIRGYRWLHLTAKINWRSKLIDIDNPQKALAQIAPIIKSVKSRRKRAELRLYRGYLRSTVKLDEQLAIPAKLRHAVIVAAYNESLDVLEPTIKALTNCDYDLSKLWLYIAYEERGGATTESNAKLLVQRYGHHFGYAQAVKHPQNIPGEVIGKGGNITYAGKQVARYAKTHGIDPEYVMVTTLDSDNRPDRQYFSYLSYVYSTQADRVHKSYQPVPMFYNNIWDVPAPMRVIATGNTFWILMEMMRPHRLRNFSSHAQSLQTLIDTDFWSVKSFVEDGHQYWRTYFRYNGRHEVIPLYMPVYQDAVLARGYWRTFKAQFIQIRRWAWGASDISYVAVQSLKNKQISWMDKSIKFLRLYEGHFSWATAPLILAFAAWFPLLLNPSFNDQVLAHQLPIIASRIQLIAMTGLGITILVSLVSLPPRPSHYRRHRSILMVLQWILLPLTSIIFGSIAALNAQTRLMFGRYLEKFDVTEKAIKR